MLAPGLWCRVGEATKVVTGTPYGTLICPSMGFDIDDLRRRAFGGFVPLARLGPPAGRHSRSSGPSSLEVALRSRER
jgi:hypothetical protein